MISQLRKVFEKVSEQEDRITTIWMSPQRYAEFRISIADYPDVIGLMGFFDLVTAREPLRNGLMATLWGAEIRIDPKEPSIRFDTERTKAARLWPTRWDIIGA